MAETIILAALCMGAITAVYLLLSGRIIKVNTELQDFKEQQRMANLQRINTDGEVDARLMDVDIRLQKLDAKVERITVLLEQNISHLSIIIQRHEEKFSMYDANIADFWKNYEIKKKH